MKVIRRFKDKETKVIYEVGDEYKGTNERVAELQKVGFLHKPKKATPKKADKNAK